jgi:hypothetical protein
VTDPRPNMPYEPPPIVRITNLLLVSFKLVVLTLLIAGKGWAQSPLFSDGFEGSPCAVNAGSSLNTDTDNYTPNTAQTTFVASPTNSGSCAAHYYTLIGTNEQTPWQQSFNAAQLSAIGITDTTTEMYFEWYDYFDGDYCFPTSSQKLLRLGFETGANKKEIGVVTQSSNADFNLQYFCGQWGDSSLCNIGDAVHTNDPLPLDTWNKIGVWVLFNTPGASDGFIKVYLNDALVMTTGDANIRGNSTKGIDFAWIGGNYSMLSGGTAACSGSRYIDDVKIYSTMPGSPTPTPTPTPGNGGGYIAGMY